MNPRWCSVCGADLDEQGRCPRLPHRGVSSNKFCPMMRQYIGQCFDSCTWLAYGKCTYDEQIIKELEDLRSMR
jgi:hypothetical protein